MPGYFKWPDLTAQAIVNGWLKTVDLGYVDEDGYLYLVDRKK
jgi:long-chain acyl-CoA synthetase